MLKIVVNDEPGFTNHKPSPDTRFIFASQDGNDANDGSTPDKAVKGIRRGVSLLRDGYPDWLLFRRGDSIREGFGSWSKSGRSKEEPMVVGSYRVEGEYIFVNGA
ncbi:MAG: hypothetical protein HC888_03975 [Candidatus Competibacteraceae bacterium]|nr:hypothetical protein [Candidatus Competibacteraceae bacterium]